MTKSWRPPDWKNDYEKDSPEPGYFSRYELVEVGADAILKKLREDGFPNDSQNPSILQEPDGSQWTEKRKGHWVFISEDSE